MTEEKHGTEQAKADDAWANVGEQFKKLGESLAAAVSATWESEETQRYFEQVKVEVSAAAQQISTAVKEAADSEEGQRVQTEFEKAADSVRSKGGEIYDEIRPELVTAFRNIRAEVDKIIHQMEQREPAASAEPPPSDSPDEKAD
jgi:hypothetical protein